MLSQELSTFLFLVPYFSLARSSLLLLGGLTSKPRDSPDSASPMLRLPSFKENNLKHILIMYHAGSLREIFMHVCMYLILFTSHSHSSLAPPTSPCPLPS